MNSAKFQHKNTSPVKWISFWKNKKNILFSLAILIISFIAYLPSLQNGFVNWDDPEYFYKNPYIINISSWGNIIENVKGIFTTTINSSYKPLVILSFAFEKVLWGLDKPEWWHLNNIILHLFCVLLVFRISLALDLKLIPAAFCALLFGIHPMRVESVAWITERKDVLYGSFYLLALYYYIKSVKLSFQKRYLIIIIISFILALFSKILAVTLPLSMLLIDYYFDRKLTLKLVYEKWLYFLLSLIIGLVGLYFLNISNAIRTRTQDYFTLFERIFIGSYSYFIYIIKSVFPYKMIPIYYYPATIDWRFYSSMIIVLVILGLIYYFFRKKKALVFGLLFYTFNIIFVLQILGSGIGFLADRLTYIAYFGLFFIYAIGLQWILEKHKKYRKLIYLATLIILGVFGYMNFEQNKIWKNGETLWSHVLEYDNLTPFAWEARAHYYSEEGRLQEALHDYSKSIQYSPDSRKSSSLVDRGITYAKLNMFDSALQDLIAAERLGSTNNMIYYYRSLIYISRKKYDKAQSDIEKYLRSNPDDLFMRLNLRMITSMQDRYKTNRKRD